MNAVISRYRKTDAEVADIFPERWSPRAMEPTPLKLEDLLPLFEAARWAPSSYNNQPWRFLYALRGTEVFKLYLGLLEKGNAAWAKNAGALLVICSRTVFDVTGKPSRTHSFDAGAAWAYLALHGSMRGLVVHGMEGYDSERTRAELGVPEDFQVEAMAAVGYPGRVEDLPKKAQEMEKPSGRKKLVEIAFEGRFGAAWA
jgi:nitroreductase